MKNALDKARSNQKSKYYFLFYQKKSSAGQKATSENGQFWWEEPAKTQQLLLTYPRIQKIEIEKQYLSDCTLFFQQNILQGLKKMTTITYNMVSSNIAWSLCWYRCFCWHITWCRRERDGTRYVSSEWWLNKYLTIFQMIHHVYIIFQVKLKYSFNMYYKIFPNYRHVFFYLSIRKIKK